MPRNAEVIRQWTILREIERARSAGVTVDDMAARCGVTTRTIRRDLQALEEAGFPLFDDRARDDGKTRWSINGQAFRGLAAGLTLAELGVISLLCMGIGRDRKMAAVLGIAEYMRERRGSNATLSAIVSDLKERCLPDSPRARRISARTVIRNYHCRSVAHSCRPLLHAAPRRTRRARDQGRNPRTRRRRA